MRRSEWRRSEGLQGPGGRRSQDWESTGRSHPRTPDSEDLIHGPEAHQVSECLTDGRMLFGSTLIVTGPVPLAPGEWHGNLPTMSPRLTVPSTSDSSGPTTLAGTRRTRL